MASEAIGSCGKGEPGRGAGQRGGTRACCPTPMMPQKHPGVRPLPQSAAFTPALYCAGSSSSSIHTLPFPCRPLYNGQLREGWGATSERGRDYRLGDGEHQGSWTKCDTTGLLCLLRWRADSCCLCRPLLPCWVGSRAALRAPCQGCVPSRLGGTAGSLRMRVYHAEAQEAWVWSHSYHSDHFRASIKGPPSVVSMALSTKGQGWVTAQTPQSL